MQSGETGVRLLVRACWLLFVVAFCVFIWRTLDTAPLGSSSPVRYTLMETCDLNAAEHEISDGYFSCGIAKAFAFFTVPNSIPWLQLKELNGRRVRVVLEVSP